MCKRGKQSVNVVHVLEHKKVKAKKGTHAVSQRQKGNTASSLRDSSGAGELDRIRKNKVVFPPLLPEGLVYSLSEALSPKKGSCSIMSMGILMLGTFSL